MGIISPNKHSQLWKTVLLLTAATLLVYSVSFYNGFVVDDEFIIVKNPKTLSLKSIPDVLFAPDQLKPYYRPLNRVTYLFDYQLAGMNPGWYHGVNIIIHLGNVILLYLVCRRFFPNRNAALITALIFAVHPANNETVNFISARNNLLALFFSLASLLAFIDARKKGLRWPLLSALFFLCGLLSKETSFMLIAVIILYTFIPLPNQEEPPKRNQLLFLLPYLFVIIIYFVMRVYSLQGFEGTSIPAEGVLNRLTLNYFIFPQYIGLLLWPVDLTVFHYVPIGSSTPLWFLPTWIAFISASFLIIRSRNQVALFGLVWFAINYVPISNIVPIPSDPIQERFLYLPAIGFFILLGVVFAWVDTRLKNKQLLWMVTVSIIITLAVLAINRNLEWKDNLSLYSSAVENDPMSVQAHYNLGTALRNTNDLSAAQHEWELALKIDPAHSDSLTQMGTLTALKGDLRTAEKFYLSALNAPPGNSDPDKSMVHYNLGKIYENQHLHLKALQHYEYCLKVLPEYYDEYKPDIEQRLARLRSVLPVIPAR